MNPIEFKEQNKVFLKPQDMTEEQCTSLPVWQGKDKEGFPVIISCWKLSPDEILQVCATGVVWLGIVGHGMPPVYVTADKPLQEV